jgi:hypothetical protein
MKPPLVRIFRPSDRKRILAFVSQLNSLQSRIDALGIDSLTELLPEAHVWHEMLEKRKLLRKQISALRSDQVIKVRVRATASYVWIGKTRVDLRKRSEFVRRVMIETAIRDQSADKWQVQRSQAERVLKWCLAQKFKKPKKRMRSGYAPSGLQPETLNGNFNGVIP